MCRLTYMFCYHMSQNKVSSGEALSFFCQFQRTLAWYLLLAHFFGALNFLYLSSYFCPPTSVDRPVGWARGPAAGQAHWIPLPAGLSDLSMTCRVVYVLIEIQTQYGFQLRCCIDQHLPGVMQNPKCQMKVT